MSHSEFEALVANQLPPSEWYNHGHYLSFAHLNPDSEIASLAIQLTNESFAAGKESQEFYEISRLVGYDAIDPIEHETAKNAYQLTAERLNLFANFYESIRSDIGHIEDKALTSEAYEQLIATIFEEQLNFIQMGARLPQATAESLEELLNELAVFYRLESGKHFNELVKVTD